MLEYGTLFRETWAPPAINRKKRYDLSDSGDDSETPSTSKRPRKHGALDPDILTFYEKSVTDQKIKFDMEIATAKRQLENAQKKTVYIYERLKSRIGEVTKERDTLASDLTKTLKIVDELNVKRLKMRNDVFEALKDQIFDGVIDESMARMINSIINEAIPMEHDQQRKNYLVLYTFSDPLERICVRVVCGSLTEIKSCENDIANVKSNPPETYNWMSSADEFFRLKFMNPVDLWERVKEKYPHFFYATATSNNIVTFLSENELRIKFENDLKNSYDMCGHGHATSLNFLKLNLACSDEAVERCFIQPRNVKSVLIEMLASVSNNSEIELQDIISRHLQRRSILRNEKVNII